MQNFPVKLYNGWLNANRSLLLVLAFLCICWRQRHRWERVSTRWEVVCSWWCRDHVSTDQSRDQQTDRYAASHNTWLTLNYCNTAVGTLNNAVSLLDSLKQLIL